MNDTRVRTIFRGIVRLVAALYERRYKAIHGIGISACGSCGDQPTMAALPEGIIKQPPGENDKAMYQEFIQQLRAVLDQQAANPISNRGLAFCTTIEGIRKPGHEPFWIQFHVGKINFQHLDSPDKDQVLGDILDDAEAPGDVELEPGGFVMFDVSRLDGAAGDSLLLRLLGDYYEAEDSAELQYSIQEL